LDVQRDVDLRSRVLRAGQEAFELGLRKHLARARCASYGPAAVCSGASCTPRLGEILFVLLLGIAVVVVLVLPGILVVVVGAVPLGIVVLVGLVGTRVLVVIIRLVAPWILVVGVALVVARV